MSSEKVYTLMGGERMPLVGYGTYKVRGRELINRVLDCALGAGYRLIDTAVVYENEQEIGEALRSLLPKHNLKREDIFITSKLPSNLYGVLDNILKVIKSSLVKLDVTFIDLYLIHWPGQHGQNPRDDSNSHVRAQTWKALIEAKRMGWVKNIGVSNYADHHIREIIDRYPHELPVVNQVEWHPMCYQQELLSFCKENSILVQAYFSLGGTSDSSALLNNAEVQKVAQNVHKSPAQVLLAWALQHGVAIIPKSLNNDHIISNFNLNFVIPDDDFRILNSLPQKRFGGNPAIVS